MRNFFFLAINGKLIFISNNNTFYTLFMFGMIILYVLLDLRISLHFIDNENVFFYYFSFFIDLNIISYSINITVVDYFFLELGLTC